MNITILNGSPEPSALDAYLTKLKAKLETHGQTVTQLDLRDLDIRYCVGCFGCWVKTPGECSNKDESCEMRRAVIHSDFTIWASPLKMGFPSATLKKTLDKSIPLIHPYFVVDHGEAHHRPRYDKYPRLGLLVEAEPDTDRSDLEIIANVFSRTALNLKSRLEFAFTTESSPEEIANKIAAEPVTYISYPRKLTPVQGEKIDPPKKLVLFNGSPRGRKGNTPILLDQFGRGFASVSGHTFEMHNLNRIRSHEEYVQILAQAECVWIGFPLYTDMMPGMVKSFIESLETLRNRDGNPPIGFLVQSGFPEAAHSRYIERYLQNLAGKLGAPYLGTIIKGGGEGVRMMPEESNRKLFDALQGLGKEFAHTGHLNPDLLSQVAGVERYPAILAPVFKLFTRLPIANFYWNSQLKENGVYEERFAKPYMD